jgi:probable phosphoglycerate mutase
VRTASVVAVALLTIGLAAGVRAQPAEPEPALRIYVVRHAQAWKNVSSAQRPPGMTDEKLDSLTEKGFARAGAIGRELADAGVARVVCSPAQRARQTAGEIASVLGLGAPEARDEFRPLDHGTERRAADYRWRISNWNAGRDPRPEGGESLSDALARAAAYLEAARTGAGNGALVVVTHGEITAALLSKAAGVSPLAGYERYFVGEGTINEIEIDATGRWRLVGKAVKP